MTEHLQAADLGPSEYEELTRELVERLGTVVTVTTQRLKRNVPVLGRSGDNQIDVIWEFNAPDGEQHLVLFECRRYQSALKRKDVFAFHGVVQDVSALTPAKTTGVMVTSTGYQKGARAVAETYGVVAIELRDPLEKDLSDTVVSIALTMTPRIPVVRNVRVEPVEVITEGFVGGFADDLHLQFASGKNLRMTDVLLAGELAPVDSPPAPLHEVTRRFDPPVLLLAHGSPVAKIRSVTAYVGEEDGPSAVGKVGGREWLKWVVRDALTGAKAWITDERIILPERPDL